MVYWCSIMSFKGATHKFYITLIFLECLHVMLCRFWWMISRPWLIDCCSSDQFLDRNIFFWNKIMHCCGVIVMMKKGLFKSSPHNPQSTIHKKYWIVIWWWWCHVDTTIHIPALFWHQLYCALIVRCWRPSVVFLMQLIFMFFVIWCHHTFDIFKCFILRYGRRRRKTLSWVFCRRLQCTFVKIFGIFNFLKLIQQMYFRGHQLISKYKFD